MAVVTHQVSLPNGARAVAVKGLHRGQARCERLH
jgi:hypothetical protein